MLQNAYFLAKIGADTAENEQHFAENLPIGRRVADRPGGGRDVRERRLAKFRQNVARFRLYRLRFLQENMRFAAFFKIYQILKLKFLKFDKSLQVLRHLHFVYKSSLAFGCIGTDLCKQICVLQHFSKSTRLSS